MNEIKKAIDYFYKKMENGLIENDEQQISYEVALSALEKQINNGWIPCSERLPKQDEEVLITDATGHVRLMWIVGDRFENIGNSVEFDFVVAWQHLPQPYEVPK